MAKTAAAAWSPIDVGKDLSQGGLVDAVFWRTASARRLAFVRSWSWATDAKTLAGIDADLVESYAWGEQALLLRDDAVIRIGVGGELELRVAAASRDAAAVVHAEILERFPPSTAADRTVPIVFWTYSPHGPRATSRRITVADWDEIAGNYTADVRIQLDRLMDGYTPGSAGQLILWQGVPGTGKTWALRALAWQWRDWASFHYVVDPERMYGNHADYLVDVLLNHVDEPQPAPAERWRILILEDSGELLTADAKERTGQALSRLLNVVDGLIGQGLRVLVLVTTNEEIRRLHPAVSRPGRCAAKITFAPLTNSEAAEWLAARDLDPIDEARTIADLYALASGEQPATVELARVGFR